MLYLPICPGTKRVSSSDNNQNSPLGLGHMCGTGGMEGGNSSTKRSRQASGMFTASFSCRAPSGYMRLEKIWMAKLVRL